MEDPTSGLTCIAGFDEVALALRIGSVGWSVPATQIC